MNPAVDLLESDEAGPLFACRTAPNGGGRPRGELRGPGDNFLVAEQVLHEEKAAVAAGYRRVRIKGHAPGGTLID